MSDQQTYAERCTCVDCKLPSYSLLPVVGGKPRCRFCASKFLHPYWPRGKYNGQRIVGITCKVAIDVTDWQLIPYVHWKHGTVYIHWLCIQSWTERNFEQ